LASPSATSRDTGSTTATARGTVAAVKGEQYYATVAQVLPTLLIAVVIELVALFRESYLTRKRISTMLDADTALDATWRDLYRNKKKAMRYINISYVVVAFFFILGELAAIAVLLFGPGDHLAGPATTLSAIAVVLMCVMAVFAPLLSTGTQLDWQSFENEVKASVGGGR
jgi:hypothetical protein